MLDENTAYIKETRITLALHPGYSQYTGQIKQRSLDAALAKSGLSLAFDA